MKTLYESILGDEDEVMNKIGDEVIIKPFLDENYKIDGSYKIHENIVDVNGNIKLIKYIEHLTNGSFKFGKVTGTFDCSLSDDLKDLIGSPEYVGVDFICNECYMLKDLTGAPKVVKGICDCSMTEITSLKGCPEEIGKLLDCMDCPKLTSIKDISKSVKKIYLDNKLKCKLETTKILNKYNIKCI